MDKQSQTVFDPMFTSRSKRQIGPAYVRRSTQYQSSSALLAGGRAQATKPSAVSANVPERATPEFRLSTPTVTMVTSAPMPAVKPIPSPLRTLRRRLLLLPVLNRQTVVLYGMAAVVFAIGLAVSLNGLRTNHVVAAQVTHLQQQTTAAAKSTDGTPGTTTVPSAVKPSAAAAANYTVSPNEPRYTDTTKISVHAEVLSEGVSSSNQLQVPWDIYDTGWYNASAQPGQPGATLIDGHSGIDGLHGVFYKLGSLVNGDQITVTRGDGQEFTYTVVKVQVVNAEHVDMQSMVVSADSTKPGLNLITCTGDQIPGTDELNERVQVYAVMQ